MSDKLYRLTARTQMHGEVREPGYTFTLAPGERGPMRGVQFSSGKPPQDVPLYEEVPPPEPPQEPVTALPSSEELAAQIEAVTARNDELADELRKIEADADAHAKRAAELEARQRQADMERQAKDEAVAAAAKASADRIAELEAQLAAARVEPAAATNATTTWNMPENQLNLGGGAQSGG